MPPGATYGGVYCEEILYQLYLYIVLNGQIGEQQVSEETSAKY